MRTISRAAPGPRSVRARSRGSGRLGPLGLDPVPLAVALVLLLLASDGATAREGPSPDLHAVDRYVER